MRVFSRIGIVSMATFGSLSGPLAWGQPAANPLSHTLVSPMDGREFQVSDGRGHWLAIHFLNGAETPQNAAFVHEYARTAPTVAGVRHIFVRPGDAGAVKAWGAALGDDARSVYADPDGAFAKDLKVETTPGTTARVVSVVFGPDGQELFRRTAASAEDAMSFPGFARELRERTRVPALGDYNVPSDQPLAVQGYDVVAYFTQHKALKGRSEIQSAYRGVNYRFATEDDRKLFAADPERYLPTYGGWCASAMGAKGTKVEIDPTNFKVKDGRLFLFYKSLFGDALKDWNKNEREWEPAADHNWKKLTGEDPVTPPK